MLAHPPLQTAFPAAVQTLQGFLVLNPALGIWSNTLQLLLQAMPNLTPAARSTAASVCQTAAKCLAYVQASAALPSQVDVYTYLWQLDVATNQAKSLFALGAQSPSAPSGQQTWGVLLSTSAANALAALAVWDPGSPVPIAAPGSIPTYLYNIATGTSLSQGTTTTPPGLANSYVSYTIAYGDTLTSIAARFAATVGGVPGLIAYNNLVYPFITTDLTQQTGIPVAQWFLQTVQVQQGTGVLWAPPITEPGVVALQLQGAAPNLGDLLVFQSPGAAAWQEVRLIIAISSDDTLTLESPLQNAYPAGSEITLCRPRQDNARVLGPGMQILIPLPAQTASGNNVQDSLAAPDSLANDIALNAAGTPEPLTGTGDIPVISGLANLQQAIRDRLSTPLGSLPLHPSYGVDFSRFWYKSARASVHAELEIRRALLQDPRIAKVDALAVSVDGSGSGLVTYTAVIELAGFRSPVTLQDQLSLAP